MEILVEHYTTEYSEDISNLKRNDVESYCPFINLEYGDCQLTDNQCYKEENCPLRNDGFVTIRFVKANHGN